MNIQSIIVKPFSYLKRGDSIIDTSFVGRILSTEWAHSVARVVTAPATRN